MGKRNGKKENPANDIRARIIDIIELKQREGFLKYLSLPLSKALLGVLGLMTVLLAMCGSWMLVAISVALVILSVCLVSKFKKQLGLTRTLIEKFLSGGRNDQKRGRAK